MAFNGCISGLGVTAVLALVLVPVHYYIPALYPSTAVEPEPRRLTKPLKVDQPWTILDFPTLDLFLTVFLLALAIITYLCDWIQRKVMEKRIVKLKLYLCESLERLHEWDARQEQLEATLRMAQNATSEYNLMLYLLLRQHNLQQSGHNQLSKFDWVVK